MGWTFQMFVKHSNMIRSDIIDSTVDEMRELVTNAFAHRSYLEHDALMFVAVYDTRVEITSPGGLPRGQTVEKAISGCSKIRNKAIAEALSYMRYVEGWGSGFLRLNEELFAYGARPVEIEDAGFATRLNVYRVAANTPADKHEGDEGNREPNGTHGTNRVGNQRRITGASVPVTAPLTAPVTAPVSEPVTSAKTLLRVIRENPGRRKQELVALTGLRPWTVKRLLEGVLRENVEYRGACRNGGYFVIDENQKV